ncbi:hypothetical protein OIV83_001003 [Microbotryomycetes sp. JL201]|nr:hypothetical protein OIV83_001003 [Microbotryomycetes sp. JL201]
MSDQAAAADPLVGAEPAAEEPACGSGSPYNGRLQLRIAAVFIILVTSLLGTLLPIFLRSARSRLRVPEAAFQFVKYFGSGVIVATGFIHLLAPAWDALTSECLTGVWTEYDWAPAIAMMSVFAIFIVELIAHRAGSAYLKRRGLRTHDHHMQAGNLASHSTHGLHTTTPPGEEGELVKPASKQPGVSVPNASEEDGLSEHGLIETDTLAQMIGVATLEFGVIFHSVIIGLTLGVDDSFVTLFVVIIFHQMFEGLGLGSRLSVLPFPTNYRWVPYVAAVMYAATTPIGLAIGIGVRNTFNPDSANSVIVSGVLDAFSAGILLYTGLVELLAHDFIFSREMAVEASNTKVTLSILSVLLGAGLMALLGRWA